MFISKLVLNPMNRQVQRDLADMYQMHRSVFSLFPDKNAGGPGRVLYRVDENSRDNEISVLLVSEKVPQWSLSKLQKDYLLEEMGSKDYAPEILPDSLLAFRLRANPSKKKNGKRLGIFNEQDQLKWLIKKGNDHGFSPIKTTPIPEGFSSGKRDSKSSEITVYSVRFDGYLKVSDSIKFKKALETGIGPAKGMGFGLLSVALAH